MSDWRSVLNGDPVDWLLEKENPSVRYFTLRDILDRPENDPEVTDAKQDIMKTGIVPAILEKQDDEGYWVDPKRFYTAKYTGTVWQVIILAELGAGEKDSRVKKACEFILNNSQDRESGGFSMSVSVKNGGGRHSEVIPCLTGNMVRSLIRLGFLDDPRLQDGIKWITTYQRFDDGITALPTGWPYDRSDACWGKHTCHMGVVKALKALAEIPENERSADVKTTIENGMEYLLIHHIYKKSHDLSRVSKPGWKKLGFPLMYQTDILEILGILTGLGCRDDRMQDAMDILISKQDKHGKWVLENTFNGRFQVDIEQKGKQSKWVTLNAIRVIKEYY
ncbi:nitrogen fixation protein NifH [Methanocella sp. CWC-04]|uniref:Nitrogen fixation protein NifH n=1 Tax=Methanooceanicella nereidis TaxID=2052831 RepID=A0AAP2W5D5_9EURY|nr:nitrogen fixation protein NifH [Methanocella sp. CWC-04]MCD1294072.1 nitrogen fixation protein NifH [Methanocella sp. CWC-04]